ncbi:hypothetical protein KHO57_gp033 [Mycobacterium phage Phabba]|uniref:Uncharacterized protein n=1 Tax=Mycobacterium phage Phabba TaxID=2027899 RepID=A0A249XSB0_9CAUD|nr:hypothetical protein KHO57_gp033 [Mycobacterium phage Phabba]ASZ74608.1 hypothetical protein SEA_PHABBA_33 [Mycobacterium phage Phabba]
MSGITFDPKAFNLDAQGRKVYWMVSWLRSETPNGTYRITKMNSRHWSISHTQVINGGQDSIVRHIGMATTREVAIRYAEIDAANLEDKILDRVLGRNFLRQVAEAAAGAELRSA